MHIDLNASGAADYHDDKRQHARAGHELHAVPTAAPPAPLDASEARYRHMFEAAGDGILVVDADTGVIVDANPHLEGLLGFGHDELVGRVVWEIDAFQEVIANRAMFGQLQGEPRARLENLPLETKGKDFREVEFTSDLYLVDGRRFMQCNIRNNTGRRRAAGELKTANVELEVLVTALRKRDAGMQLLNRMTSLLQACNTQDEACRVIAMMAGEMFAGQDGSLAVLRADSPDLEVVAQWGTSQAMAGTFAPHDCWAIRRGQPHEVADAQSGLPCHHFIDTPGAGYLCIPLTVQGESLGLLCLMGDHLESGEVHLGRRNLALTIAEAIKLSLYNLRLQERLREQATRDPLTGLVNRRFLEDSMNRELHRCLRNNTTLGLAVLDLDHFKQFNDAFGHEAGDHLLTQVGAVFGAVMRKSDIACRYGGEEFVLVFPETSRDDVQRRVEEIRTMIHGLAVRHDDRLLGPITVSAGLAMAPEHGTSARELLAAADEAMYAAKRDGRNRLACCGRDQSAASRALIVIETSDPGSEHGPGSTSLVAWRRWPGPSQ